MPDPSGKIIPHFLCGDVGVRLCRRKRLETDYYFLNGRREGKGYPQMDADKRYFSG
jgi:hypothetical protein